MKTVTTSRPKSTKRRRSKRGKERGRVEDDAAITAEEEDNVDMTSASLHAGEGEGGGGNSQQAMTTSQVRLGEGGSRPRVRKIDSGLI